MARRTKRFGGLQVDDTEFVLLAAKLKIGEIYLLEIGRRSGDLSIRFGDTWSVADQTAFDGIFPKTDRWRAADFAQRTGDVTTAVRFQIWVGRDLTHRPALLTMSQRLCRIAIVAGLGNQKLPTKFWRSQFQITYLICRRRIIRVDDRTEEQ